MSDADCPPTGNATKCYGPAPTAKVCCLDEPGMTWNHPCQVCIAGIRTFNCPGTAAQGCAEPIYMGVAPLCTTQIPCLGRARGWNGAACERFTANENGKCRPGGLCNTATDFALCDIAAVNVAQTCADVRCIDPSRCQLGDTNIATLDDVCLIAGEQGTCPSGSTCDKLGACKKNLGQPCSAASECQLPNGDPGFCQQGVCCNVASCAGTGGIGGECRRCDRAASLGTCTADTGVACGGPDAINCNALASGFVSGNICQRFADNTTGLCDNTGTCIKTDTQRCIDNAAPRTGLFTCGDVECVDAGTCVSSSNKVCGATTMSNAELTAQIQNTFNATATHRAAESGGPIASTRVTVYRTVQAGNLDTQIVVACTALNAAAFDMLANIRELIVTITTKFTGPLQFQRAVFKVASLSEVLRPHGQKFDRNYSLAAALDGWTPNVTHPGVPVYMTTVLAAPRHTTAAPAAAVSATAASATAAAASASRPPGAGGSSAHRVPDAPRTRPQQQQQQSQQQQQRQQQQHSKAGAKSSHGMSDNDDDDDNNYGGKQKPTSAGYKTVASRKSPRMPTPKKTFQQTVASKSKPAATASKTAPKAKPSSSSTSSQQRKQVQDTNDYATEYYLAKPPPVTFQDAFSASESAATKTPNTKRKVDNLHASSANTDSSSPTTSPAHKHPHIDVDNIDSPSPAAAEPETETVQEQQPQECCTSASQQQLLQAPTTADSAGVETERQGETETGDRQ
jgi:hypothetical protein